MSVTHPSAGWLFFLRISRLISSRGGFNLSLVLTHRTIPYWPRGLSVDWGAAYVGVSPNKFLAEVAAGIWPKPETRGGRRIWDRQKLDQAWNRRDAGEEEADPLMEALDDCQN